jgi:hypothetical protein
VSLFKSDLYSNKGRVDAIKRNEELILLSRLLFVLHQKEHKLKN